jgi:two-component system phosphate regulon sensor histidine kinase PhoR
MQPDALSPARQGSGSITELESETRTRAENQAGSIPGKLGEVAHDTLPAALSRQPAIRLAVILDAQLTALHVFLRTGDERSRKLLSQLGDSLTVKRQTLERLLHYQKSGYRKIEPILMRQTNAPALLALLSVAPDAQGRYLYSLLCIDSELFIENVLSTKFQEIAGGDFILTCSEVGSGRMITSTAGGEASGDIYQRRKLWLFPDYSIGIRLRGKTVADLARERFVTNGLLFAAVDLLLILGVWFVYRNLKRQLQLAEMKTDFVSNISHELKTPLAVIRMYAETLEMGRISDQEKQREYHSIIVQESDRLTRLINNILTFSRIESGKKDYRKVSLDLNAVLREVLSVYRFHLEHKGFETSVVEGDNLPMIEADEEAVAEALLNLLDNAMKYSSDVKRITVRTGSNDSEAWVEVEDRGVGIPLPLQKKIFEKFYRVSEGLVHTAKGSGLGLALVEHIMHAHNGRIELHSVPGEGSRFRLIFPVPDHIERLQHGTHSDH